VLSEEVSLVHRDNNNREIAEGKIVKQSEKTKREIELILLRLNEKETKIQTEYIMRQRSTLLVAAK
jgi:hypothetical protein